MKYKQKRKIKKTLFIVLTVILVLSAGIFGYLEIKKHNETKDVTNEFNKILSKESADNLSKQLFSEYLAKNNIEFDNYEVISIDPQENKVVTIIKFKNEEYRMIIVNKDKDWKLDSVTKKG